MKLSSRVFSNSKLVQLDELRLRSPRSRSFERFVEESGGGAILPGTAVESDHVHAAYSVPVDCGLYSMPEAEGGQTPL